jgi:hypothetical protein
MQQAVAIALTVAMTAVVSVQEKPAGVVPKKGDAVVVRGCITSGTIQSNELELRDSTGLYSAFMTFRIAGDKKLVNSIKKEHEGHADVLIGTLKSDLPDANAPRSTRVGNTRITIGAGPQAGSNRDAPPSMPVLSVSEIEHSGMNCRT